MPPLWAAPDLIKVAQLVPRDPLVLRYLRMVDFRPLQLGPVEKASGLRFRPQAQVV